MGILPRIRYAQRDVESFHRRFGFSIGAGPSLPSRADLEQRRLLIEEEFRELMHGIDSRDLESIAQESIDLIYVVLGGLVQCGVDAEPICEAIHEANMRKEPCAGSKPTKPADWVPPGVRGILVRQGAKL